MIENKLDCCKCDKNLGFATGSLRHSVFLGTTCSCDGSPTALNPEDGSSLLPLTTQDSERNELCHRKNIRLLSGD
jgi:hypothetical protein